MFYNGVISDQQPVTLGVPQGSALGPLLFLVYVNSLPECIKFGNLNMLADDTILFYTGKDRSDIENKLNMDLNFITDWLSSCFLSSCSKVVLF